MEDVEDKTQGIELMQEEALEDVYQVRKEKEEEDVAVVMGSVVPEPEAFMVSMTALEEQGQTKTAVVESTTESASAAQAEVAAVVEEVTLVPGGEPVPSDETELQETSGSDVSYDVTFHPEDISASEQVEAPVKEDEAAKTTPEVASFVKTTSASEEPPESLEIGEDALASLGEDVCACEVSGPSESASQIEAKVLGDDTSKGEGEAAVLTEAQAAVDPLEPCETLAPCETGVDCSVALQDITVPEEPEVTGAEAPVNWEAPEHAEVEMTPESPPTPPITDDSRADIRPSGQGETEQHAVFAEVQQPDETCSLTEPSAAPAPEEECEAADLDVVEEALALLPIPSQSSSEEDPPPQAKTTSPESLSEGVTQVETAAVESMPADLGTVSIFR